LLGIQVQVHHQAPARAIQGHGGDDADDLGTAPGAPDFHQFLVLVDQFQGVAGREAVERDLRGLAAGPDVVHRHAFGVHPRLAGAAVQDHLEFLGIDVDVVDGGLNDPFHHALVQDADLGHDLPAVADLAPHLDFPVHLQVLEADGPVVGVVDLHLGVDVVGLAVDADAQGAAAGPQLLDDAGHLEGRGLRRLAAGADVDDLPVDHVGPGRHARCPVVDGGQAGGAHHRGLTGDAVRPRARP